MTEPLTREAAAEARSAGRLNVGYHRRALAPGDTQLANHPCGNARALPFGAKMRAKLTERNGQPMYHLNGIASVTDKPYEMWDFFGPYDEVIERGAFTDTLASEPDVAFLVNHRGVTMARTTNGTLELGMVDEGLQADAWLNPKRQDVTDTVIAVEDGSLDQMSFAFLLEEGWWSDDFTTFRISKLDIHRGDVSVVNYGANPYTSIEARQRETLADLEHAPVGVARAALARLAGRNDLTQVRASNQGMDLAHLSAWLIQHT